MFKTTHGESWSPLYWVWQAMKQRCLNPNNAFYKRYGGRGIVISEEWLQFAPFQQWAMRSGYGKGRYLDRENNDGPYSAENCQWVTSFQSGRNRSTTKLSPDKVVEIRAELASGKTGRGLAPIYGVNERSISEIKCGNHWTWVEGVATS